MSSCGERSRDTSWSTDMNATTSTEMNNSASIKNSDSISSELEHSDCDSKKVPKFKIMTTADIENLMDQYVEEVKEFLEPNIEAQLPATKVRILLYHTKWDKQELLDRLTDENRDTFCEAAHFPNPFAEINETEVSQDKPHENNKFFINSFVEHNHLLRWCPSHDCTLAVKAEYLPDYRQNCSCKCGKSFCFNCGKDSHDPIPCKWMNIWEKNVEDNIDQTILYVEMFIKSCPNCQTTVERIGNLNHMTCMNCDHGFCWSCSDVTHNGFIHRCTIKAPVKLRWQHYYERYGHHKMSLESEHKLVLVEKFKDQMYIQFLNDANKMLWEIRKQIMLTYIFAYFARSNEIEQVNMFEFGQYDLEMETEKLSQCIQHGSNLDETDRIAYFLDSCQMKQSIIQNHIYEGFEKNYWIFSDEPMSQVQPQQFPL